MAKLLFLIVALSVLGLALANSAPPTFTVQGRVYCDTCRAGFETSATEYVEGAKVVVECRHYSNNTVAHSAEGVTNSTGYYNIQLEDDHQEEICEVVLVNSPQSDCSEVIEGRDRARILLTNNNGINSLVRYANALGFLKTDPLPICGELLQQYALGDLE